MSFQKKWRLIIILISILSTLLIADDHQDLIKQRVGKVNAPDPISEDERKEILAEFDGGTITRGELEDKINSIQSMYQPRFHSPEGKADLLEQMAVESMFYKESLALYMHEDEDYVRRLENQKVSLLARNFKSTYMNENLTFSDEEKRRYYVENSDKFPGKTFEEAEQMVVRYMRPEKERELSERLKDSLMEKYNIEIHQSVVDAVNIDDLHDNENIENDKIITSSEPDLEMTVGEFVLLFTDNPNHKNVPLNNTEDLLKIINMTLESFLFGYEAKQQGYDKDKEFIETFERLSKNLLLQTTYNKLVVDRIDLSEQALRKYYDDNIKEFSTKPYRKIQEFVFDDEKTAKKVLKSVKKAKNNEEKIDELVREYSKNPKNDGYLPNIYQNKIIPGLGKDEEYSEMVWKTSPKKISKIFQNRKEEYVFFRIVEDVEAVATPFEEEKEMIKQTKFKKEQTELFDEIKEELAKKYHLKTYPDKLIVKLSAEEYFNKAEESQKRRRFRDALYYYDQVIKFYPNQQDDYKALFMKGFILAENLNEKKEALQIFEQVINDYPVGELHESAQFMMDELKGNKKENTFFNEE